MMSFYYWFREGSIKDHGVIYCEIRVDGEKSVPFSTKIKLHRKHWNSKEQCFSGKESAKHQKMLDFYELRFTQIYTQISYEKPNEPIRPSEILDRHRFAHVGERKTKEKEIEFMDVFKEFLADQNKLLQAEKLSELTVKGKESKYAILRKYLGKKKIISIPIKDVNTSFLDEFKFYLQTSKYQDSTIEKYLVLIKEVSTYGVSKGYSKESVLDDYKIEKAKAKEPVSLTKEEMDKMEALELSPVQRLTLDIYRFCAETSLSYTDYNSLSDERVEIDKDKTIWIKLNREKTDITQRIPLNDKALEIFCKYGGAASLPRLSNNKLNLQIKEIAKMANIKKHITFHTSRKSFVDYTLNELAIPATTISAMVGWKDTKQLSRYAKVKDSTIKKQFLK
ncbi:tyrosine-type recombinase/integrase [Emticicia sp. ODNR4P]|nr:tyrosine-type recombinase/integrase [Emticicia sp. ODNR4P]